jgi:hypothetical protein
VENRCRSENGGLPVTTTDGSDGLTGLGTAAPGKKEPRLDPFSTSNRINHRPGYNNLFNSV